MRGAFGVRGECMVYAIGQPSAVVNMGISIPLLAEEGWLRRQPPGCRRRGGGQFGNPFAGLLLRLRPVGLALRATRLRLASLGASTPPLRGGECVFSSNSFFPPKAANIIDQVPDLL